MSDKLTISGLHLPTLARRVNVVSTSASHAALKYKHRYIPSNTPNGD